MRLSLLFTAYAASIVIYDFCGFHCYLRLPLLLAASIVIYGVRCYLWCPLLLTAFGDSVRISDHPCLPAQNSGDMRAPSRHPAASTASHGQTTVRLSAYQRLPVLFRPQLRGHEGALTASRCIHCIPRTNHRATQCVSAHIRAFPPATQGT
jgi:hypothetical protein